MRSLLRGERLGNVGVVLGLLAILGLVSTLLTLVLIQSGRLDSDCQQRRIYDASSQHTREVFRTYYLEQIQQEQANPYVGPDLRRQRVASARHLLAALDDTLGKSVQTQCGGLL